MASLFGNPQPATQPTSLFAPPASAPASNSLFGNTANNNSTSLFGNANTNQPNAQNNNPLFAPAANNLSTQFQTGLGGTLPGGSLNLNAQQDLARSRLQQYGIDNRGNQKSIIEQAQTLIVKWDPQAQDTLLQAYLYNAVNAAYAPFYHRNPDEDERSWEAALAEKPKPSDDAEGQQISYVPVLVRGFAALGKRVEYQANIINEMRARLHEMNNSLTAVMTAHQQRLSVRIEAARRQHAVISQRCLRLAVKTQVLRSRGYALEQPEEQLRKMLLNLEQQVMDPTFTGREEEVWARMLALRERACWLEEEGKKVGQQVEQQQGAGLPEDVLLKTQKILQDYDGQLRHLSRELEDVKKEYTEWAEGNEARSQRR